MAKVSPLQGDFSVGEISPLFQGRVSTEIYQSAVDTSKNRVGTLQGASVRRPGSKFVKEVKDSSKTTRLIPFEFSTTQAYQLEFGDQYIRFYKDNAIITQTAQDITGITKANPAVVTYSGSDTYSNGDRIIITGVVGMHEVNNREFTVANVNTGSNTFELSGVNSTNYTTYVSGGTVAEIYEISTSYLESEIEAIQFAQSADILYLVHPNHFPAQLTRTGHTSWTLSSFTNIDGPYQALQSSITVSVVKSGAGPIYTYTFTASAALFTNWSEVFQHIRWLSGGVWYWGTLSYTSSTVATTTSRTVIADVSNTTDFRLGLWTDDNFPSSVCFHEDRLVFSGVPSNPGRIDASETGDYTSFSPTEPDGTVVASNALSFTPIDGRVNTSRWTRSDEKGLLAGTAGSEFVVKPSAQSEALSATNISAKKATSFGSNNTIPVQVGKATLYVQKAGRKLREFLYSYESDGHVSNDLTFLAGHLTISGFKELAYQAEPYPIVWAARNDGILLGMSYERENQSLKCGWHQHQIGGVSDADDTPAIVESLSVIPSADGTSQELWMIVKRLISGSTKRYVEYLTSFFENDMDLEDAFFVDCGLTYSGSAATTITGLHHLEGETVIAHAGGADAGEFTVTNGSITLSTAATPVQIGYKYESDLKLLRLEAGAQDGTALGKTRRIHATSILLYQTGGMKIGTSFDSLDEINFRTDSDSMDAGVPLFSGLKRVKLDMNYDTENQICIRQDGTYPGTILAIAPQMATQDR